MDILDSALVVEEKIDELNETVSILDDEAVMIMHRIFVWVVSLYIPIIMSTNTLVFWGIVLYPGFYTSNNMLLVSLACADFLMGGFCLPLYILCYSWPTREIIANNKYACLTRLSSVTLTVGGSIVSLLMITIDRYLAILYPFLYSKWISVERTIKAIVAMWLLVLCIAIIPFLGWNNYDYEIKDPHRRCNFYITVPWHYVLWANIVTSQSCILLSAALNGHIIYVVRKQIIWFRAQKSRWSKEQSRHFEQRVNSVKITVTLMVLFIILWFPYLMIAPLKLNHVFSPENIEVAKCITLLISFANSLVNAPIYAILRVEYRAVYRRMLTTSPMQWKSELRNLYRLKHSVPKKRKKKSSTLLSNKENPRS
ncbi:adenosine receptor A2b [Biomphalaria glabrata]|nr:adenosine receptor A2b [Biomphalaria glabrata]